MSDSVLYSALFDVYRCFSFSCFHVAVVVVVVVVATWLVPCETAAVSAHVLCTPYKDASDYGVTSFKATWVFIWNLHRCLLATHL